MYPYDRILVIGQLIEMLVELQRKTFCIFGCIEMETPLQHKTWWTKLKKKAQAVMRYFKLITGKGSKSKICEILLQIGDERKNI